MAVLRAPGVRNPLKSSVTGASLLDNCYLEHKFRKKIKSEPPPPPPPIKNKPENIILLEETQYSLHTRTRERIEKKWDGELYFSHDITVNNVRNKCQGRVMLVELTIEAVNYCVVNIYSPNNDVHEFIEKLFLKTLGISREDHLIMGGDWNTVLKNNLDKLVGAAQHANIYYQNYINGITNDYGLCDIYRLTRGKKRMYTHFNKQYKTASRLDFFLIDDNLVNLPVCKTDISHGYNSDHRYVLLTIQGSSILKEVEDTENLTTRTYRMRSLLWRYGKTKKKRNKKKKNN